MAVRGVSPRRLWGSVGWVGTSHDEIRAKIKGKIKCKIKGKSKCVTSLSRCWPVGPWSPYLLFGSAGIP